MKGSIIEIDYQTAVDFLLPRHYSGRIPTIQRLSVGMTAKHIPTNI